MIKFNRRELNSAKASDSKTWKAKSFSAELTYT